MRIKELWEILTRGPWILMRSHESNCSNKACYKNAKYLIGFNIILIKDVM